MNCRQYFWTITLFFLCASEWTVADVGQETLDKRLEIGVGVGALVMPDYRGSKTYRHYAAPIPYVIYRGKIISSDRDGVRGNLFRSDQIEFNLSMAASIRPDSDRNELRRGMPALASTLEVGPALQINLTGDSLRDQWMLALPVRAVFTIDRGSPEHIGWFAEPQVSYRFRLDNWNWSFRAGPSFASNDYHEYYYGVGSEYVLPDRALYSARGGYSGFNSQFALSRRSGKVWYAFFVRHYHLKGVDFIDSPMVETSHGGSGGFAISWILF